MTGTVTSTDTHLPPNWERRLLALVGAPGTVENVRFLKAWATAEGGVAKWNPLNVTYQLSYGQSWPLAGNTSGVQNYYKPTAGICATALLLIQSVPGASFAGILGDLQAGSRKAEEIVNRNADALRVWGTGADAILRVLATTP